MSYSTIPGHDGFTCTHSLLLRTRFHDIMAPSRPQVRILTGIR